MFIKTDKGNMIPVSAIKALMPKDGRTVIQLNSGGTASVDSPVDEVIASIPTRDSDIAELMISQMEVIMQNQEYLADKLTQISSDATSKVEKAVSTMKDRTLAITRDMDKVNKKLNDCYSANSTTIRETTRTIEKVADEILGIVKA